MKEEEIHNDTCQCPETIEELVDDIKKHPYRYQHLKVFLRRDGIIDFPEFGEEYLMVCNEGFGVYKIDNIVLSPRLIKTECRCKTINYNGIFLCGKKCGKKLINHSFSDYPISSPANGLSHLHFHRPDNSKGELNL